MWSSVMDWVEAGSPEEYRDKSDNLQLALRDTLLYHVLNFTLFPPPANSSSSNSSDSTPSDPSPIDEDLPQGSPLPFDIPTLQETLYYPSLFPYNRSFPAPPSLPGSPPDKLPKKEPQDRPEGLLHGEGQKVRIIRKKRENETWVGVDWKGAGGVKAAGETLFAQNGALVSIDGVLQKPKDLGAFLPPRLLSKRRLTRLFAGELVRSTPELSVFASLLPPQVLDYLTTVSHLTLFAPTNEAWGILSDLEMRYLRSGFAELDIAEVFGDVASRSGAGRGRVGYLERLVGSKGENKTEVTTLRNATLELTGGRDATEASVNGTAVITGDILAKNGASSLLSLYDLVSRSTNCRCAPHRPLSPPSLGFPLPHRREIPHRPQRHSLRLPPPLRQPLTLRPSPVPPTRNDSRVDAPPSCPFLPRYRQPASPLCRFGARTGAVHHPRGPRRRPRTLPRLPRSRRAVTLQHSRPERPPSPSRR